MHMWKAKRDEFLQVNIASKKKETRSFYLFENDDRLSRLENDQLNLQLALKREYAY